MEFPEGGDQYFEEDSPRLEAGSAGTRLLDPGAIQGPGGAARSGALAAAIAAHGKGLAHPELVRRHAASARRAAKR